MLKGYCAFFTKIFLIWEKTSIFWHEFPYIKTRKPALGVAFVHIYNKKIFSLGFRLLVFGVVFFYKLQKNSCITF